MQRVYKKCFFQLVGEVKRSVLFLPVIVENCSIESAWSPGLALLSRVRTGHGKPVKLWNFIISFSRPGKS